MIKSVVRFSSSSFAKKLLEFQTLIRSGSLEQAVDLLATEFHMSREWAHSQVKREANFLRTIDASIAIGTARSKTGLSPRQALIMAAIVGWHGDDPGSWPSPVSRATLLAWGESHYQGPLTDLEVALDALVLQDLFFDVHPAIFATTCYYCTFDPEFLEEIPDDNTHHELWFSMREDYDAEHGLAWRRAGLCAGQGRQGPSGVPLGLCIGTCCVWFRDGEKHCNWDLEYNPELRPPIPSVGRSTV